MSDLVLMVVYNGSTEAAACLSRKTKWDPLLQRTWSCSQTGISEWSTQSHFLCVHVERAQGKYVCGSRAVMVQKVCVFRWWWWNAETRQLRRCAGMPLFVKHKAAEINLQWQLSDAQHRPQQSHTHTHTRVHCPCSFHLFMCFPSFYFLFSYIGTHIT